MTEVPALHAVIGIDVGTGGGQEERVIDRYIIERCAGISVRRIQVLVNTWPEHVIVEDQSAHRSSWRKNLHPVRVGAAWIVARGLKVVERLARVVWICSYGTQP
jgi:hypothetical protein